MTKLPPPPPDPPEKTPGGSDWRPGISAFQMPADWDAWTDWELYKWACHAEQHPNPTTSAAEPEQCEGEADDDDEQCQADWSMYDDPFPWNPLE